jgi:hypothetical protein
MWFVVGLLLGALILAGVLWLRSRGFAVRWYEWTLAVLGLLLLMFSLQNFWSTQSEHWSIGTPYTFLLVFGIPAAVLLMLAVLLIAWRYLKSTRASGKAAGA